MTMAWRIAAEIFPTVKKFLSMNLWTNPKLRRGSPGRRKLIKSENGNVMLLCSTQKGACYGEWPIYASVCAKKN